MITNLDTDPNGFKRRYQWGDQTVKREDGHYMYVGTGNTYMGACTHSLALNAPVGYVIVLIAQTDDSPFAKESIWNADELLATQDGDIYIKASRITQTNKTHELSISECVNGVTILGSALYTPADWNKIHDLYAAGILQYPWTDGDNIPLGWGVHTSADSSAYPHAIRMEVTA